MTADRSVGVTLLGMGTVGSGVVRILAEGGAMLAERAGGPIALRHVLVRDLGRARATEVDPALLTDDANVALADPAVSVVIEVMGGLEPARSHVLRALRAGRRVVTANKALVATHGPELLAAARQGGGGLHFEAAAAGAIPIVKAVRESLAANRVQALLGIVNGTCNYILSQMSVHGTSFADALADAQRLGYAEADPSSDVGGQDSAFKLALLAGLAFDCHVPVQDIACEGIAAIRAADIAMARELGGVIKLLAVATPHEAGIELRVQPAMIPASHPLAAVSDAFNAVFICGDAAGELMFYGQGAGMMPTASAVVADLIDACRDLRRAVPAWTPRNETPIRLLPPADARGRFYVALRVVDRPGVLAAIAGALADHSVSIETCIQKGRDTDPVELVFVTHDSREGDVRAALAAIADLEVVREVACVIRQLG